MDSKEYFRKLKRKFIWKMISKYYAYGYICLFGFLVSVWLIVFLISLRSVFSFISVIPAITAVVALVKLIRITSTTKYKWKFFKVYTYRITRKPFDELWFANEMYEPCMRLIIRDLCFEHGYKEQYHEMYRKYAHEDHFIQMKKQELLDAAYASKQ